MLTINPPGTTYRHTRARYHLVYTRVYTLSLSLSLFPSFSFRAPFLSLSLALPRSISPSLSARSLHSSATSVRHKRAACAHAPLFLSLSLPLSPLAGLVLYTTIVRPLIWFPHSIFVSLGSIVSFAPSEACRPHPNPLCISPLLCAATSSSSPLPLFDSLSAGLSFTLQRASLSLPTPPTPDTRHPIPNYVKRFRILRPDYAASLPSRDSSLSLSLSLAHTPHRSSLFRRVLSLTLPFAIYISVPLPRYRSRLPPKRICSCKRSRKIVENRRLRLSTLYLLRAFSRSTAISPSFPNTVFFSSSADYKIMEKTGGGEKRKRKRAITIVTRPIVP